VVCCEQRTLCFAAAARVQLTTAAARLTVTQQLCVLTDALCGGRAVIYVR